MPTVDLSFIEDVEETIRKLLGEMDRLERDMAPSQREIPARQGLSSLDETFERHVAGLASLSDRVVRAEAELEESRAELRKWTGNLDETRVQAGSMELNRT